MFPEPRRLAAEDLHIGLAAQWERDITEADVLQFAANSGDANPLHVDEHYAASTSYKRRIVHGAFQVGLASAMAGMHLPGMRVLLGSINARFPSPLFFPCHVRVCAQVVSWQAAALRGNLKVTVNDAASGITTAEIFLGFTLHEQPRRSPVVDESPREAVAEDAKQIVLLSGASGGVGSELAVALARRYRVLAMVNRTPLPPALKNNPNVTGVEVDLAHEDWAGSVAAGLRGQPLFGIVHAAWPGMPKGGLLGAPDDVILDQLFFGTASTVRLARLLFSCAGAEGGRLVLLGSIAGTHHPNAATAAYSLGKAAMEHTVRLLAPELARKNITINALCPSFLPVGMNEHSSERQRLIEMSSIPMGRLCAPADLCGAALFLLAPEAGIISGQVIGVNGGQL